MLSLTPTLPPSTKGNNTAKRAALGTFPGLVTALAPAPAPIHTTPSWAASTSATRHGDSMASSLQASNPVFAWLIAHHQGLGYFGKENHTWWPSVQSLLPSPTSAWRQSFLRELARAEHPGPSTQEPLSVAVAPKCDAHMQ
ncbi:hypothetical protein COCMIDRAFT_22336 [Bipolaris oryzae ATCC 44560]|uniref:Uncharacterized protein n=1 Tax=Bipolaris oryzae ATCC 44560 TaxID=930090 RepID=W6ZJR0_COCMI|nr:uncharacterized protein COCMIDRAFT_22336 [Bipolaris oryzae ATCC 44560]EUC50243.1 hypothetical protein COCMIDRAFT_22336 [Bipolaris oryzae ATCC 44560]